MMILRDWQGSSILNLYKGKGDALEQKTIRAFISQIRL